MRKTLIAAPMLAIGLVASGTVLAGAEAHTATGSGTCDGVTIHATNYDGSKVNKASITINGSTTNYTFGASLDQRLPVPQAGASSTWSVHAEAFDGGFKQDASGKVGPCGTPPKPDDKVVKTQSDDKNCDTKTITTHYTVVTTGSAYDKDSNTWKPTAPVTTHPADTTRPATAQECPVTPPVNPPPSTPPVTPPTTPPVLTPPPVVKHHHKKPHAAVVVASKPSTPAAPTAAPVGVLPNTGNSTQNALGAAGGLSLLIAGIGAMAYDRKRRKMLA